MQSAFFALALFVGCLIHAYPLPAQTPAGHVRRDTLTLFDTVRHRPIPVALYVPVAASSGPRKLAILSHGYGGTNKAYSFIAHNLVAHGYVVASIQHELPTDEPMPTTGKPYDVRMPNWQRGVQNIRFVVRELKRRETQLDVGQLLLVGHSNGGDMSALYARQFPDDVVNLITLDNRRMPLPRTRRPRVLSLRSSDQPADEGVLPTPTEQQTLGIRIVALPDTRHNDMWDGATESQKAEMNRYISAFLAP
ncbi:alpha/beta hydrolase [Fibrisoma montanum]|uniref:Alpha/beta hydrolase n=1 Tax=Fibrisoma montanum TaxID=2305895 RepID=A0A418M280_9BACT|nr:alpha/beta hydrolase [Fibrisoma montanum]RIV19852.1 alpha/beta hydrolase [Fibrisoma montanum]